MVSIIAVTTICQFPGVWLPITTRRRAGEDVQDKAAPAPDIQVSEVAARVRLFLFTLLVK